MLHDHRSGSVRFVRQAATAETGRDGGRRADSRPRRFVCKIHRAGTLPSTSSSNSSSSCSRLLLLSHATAAGLPHKEHVGYRTVAEASTVRFLHAFSVTAEVLPARRRPLLHHTVIGHGSGDGARRRRPAVRVLWQTIGAPVTEATIVGRGRR